VFLNSREEKRKGQRWEKKGTRKKRTRPETEDKRE
jgi:hypothetical protein